MTKKDYELIAQVIRDVESWDSGRWDEGLIDPERDLVARSALISLFITRLRVLNPKFNQDKFYLGCTGSEAPNRRATLVSEGR